MYGNGQVQILQRLFSRATVVALFLVVLALLAVNFYTYLQDRKLQSVSLGALRMASWNLAQLGAEAAAFDREMALMSHGVGDAEAFSLRYDVLWSRYDYLLHSQASLPTRRHQDNRRRLEDLFQQLQALEPDIRQRLAQPEADWQPVAEAWERQKAGVAQLVIDNFVGDETGRLMAGVEASRDRLAKLRMLTLAVLLAVFVFLALAMMFLRRQSRVDPVTGLPNSHYLRTLRRVEPDRAVITCEIRAFQLVLSEYGSDAVNQLVRLFVRKLRQQLEAPDQLIQVSQGEFVLLLRPRPGQALEATVNQLVAATHFDWRTPESVVHISATYGVDPHGEAGDTDWNARYQQAHRALAQAHLDGLPYYIAGADLRRRIREERTIHNGLVRFFNGEAGSLRLFLVYQPIVLAENRHHITGAEVLLRCQDDELGFVPPNRVVDICERVGLGKVLGRWLFRRVASETRALYCDLGFRGQLSINLNPAMLTEQLVDDVQALLLDPGLPPSALCMEITEDHAALDFARINDLIGRLHQLGVSVALDDFGTGHSSLEYVRELRVDRLKIDRCFVDGIEHSEDKSRFLGSIIAMAQQAYMKSVIEGVENEAQWQQVRHLGGTLIQGYHAYRPMPLADYLALLADRQTVSPVQAPGAGRGAGKRPRG